MPEFRPENLGKAPSWHDVMAASEIPDDEVRRVDCDGRGLFVYRKDDSYKVYDSRCPHQVTNIPHLALHGKELTCPKHHWKFDITTGECTAKGTHPLKTFESKVESGRLMAYW
jgi:nitrite reductase/ring-hydroxylating ferredoxin subunit